MTETARTTAAADPAAPPPPPARATGTVPQPAHGVPDAPAAPRRLGVEEEFHLVDRVTRRLAPRAPELLDLLSSEDCYVAEMQQCVVETNTAVVDDLPALRNELIARRTRLAEAAAQLGLGIVAAGAVPLALPSEMSLTRAPRYRRMLADYQLLAREQLICGTQVHVDVADRDEAVAVANRVAPHLPTLLALSASSPYGSTGSDTGYASARTLVWQRWPTTGLASQTESAQDFDAMVAQLVDSGVITDPGMIYFDVRPSSQAPTLELRICDSCPSVDTIVLVAGLFRALVDREARARRDGIPAPEVLPVLGRAAVWRAARSGLEEDLVDVERARSRPARDVVHDLVASLEDDLRANGDWDTVRDLAESVLLAGSSAARQRRALRRRGRLTDVVDLLVAETSNAAIQALAPDGPDAILAAYLPTPAQEVAARDGARRPRGTTRRSPPTARPGRSTPGSSGSSRRSAPPRCGTGTRGSRTSSGPTASPSRSSGMRRRASSPSTSCRGSSPRRTGTRSAAAPGSGRARSTTSSATSTGRRRSSPTGSCPRSCSTAPRAIAPPASSAGAASARTSTGSTS